MKRQASKIVLDASAVLALILNEPGGERVRSALDESGQARASEIAISTVNWCEVLTRLQRSPVSLTSEELAGILSGVELIPFEKSNAEIAAQLNLPAPLLSLGDRACLALAITHKATAWTTDKAWARVRAGVAIEILR